MVTLSRLQIKAFLAVQRMRRAMTLGVRAAVLDGEGKVLLVRHSYTPGWYLPGGGVEKGETTEVALERELMEEGGVALAGPAELFGLYLNRTISSRDHVALFVCRQWLQEKAPQVPNLEILEWGFFSPVDLPSGTTDATRRRLAEIAGGPKSPHW